MPLLVYNSPDFPFIPFTVIRSADMNQMFNDIKTLLNVTKLDDVNIQNNGITMATKLKPVDPNEVVITDTNGHLTTEQFLAYARGGLGADLTPGADGYVIQTQGGAFTLQPQVVTGSASNVFLYLYNS